MKELFRKFATAYFAGALGGLAYAAAAWLLGAWHVYAWLHVSMSAPSLSWGYLTHRLLDGSLWGLLIVVLSPLLKAQGAMLGLVLGLFPAAYMLLIHYPTHRLGMFGSGLGSLAFLVVILLYGVWGILTALLYTHEYKA